MTIDNKIIFFSDNMLKHQVNEKSGVEHQVKEKSQEVLEKVVNIIKEFEAEISESFLDTAHRIGPTYTDNNNGKKMQSIIVRFTTFRHRTLL